MIPPTTARAPNGSPRDPRDALVVSERLRALHEEVLHAPRRLCAERARLVTRYFRAADAHPGKPMITKKGEALAYVLRNKRVAIHPRELLVGTFTSHRVGGGLFPELHGLMMLEDLGRFRTRSTNPIEVSREEARALRREVFPYWLTRFLVLRAMPFPQAVRFSLDQLAPTFYLINEGAGVSHFVPNYRALLERGTEAFRREAEARRAVAPPDSDTAAFWGAVEEVCRALEAFAAAYRGRALELAAVEPSPERRRELHEIAAVCERVPKHPAATFREGLQSILFAQIALNLESLDNSVSPGRLDQILWPLYRNDLATGRLDRARAFELLGCFAVKLSELVPVFSRRITRFHGGMFNGQVVVVGGTDERGDDATNELSHLFVALMDRLRTRQPNYHARLHEGSPPEFRAEVAEVLARGSASPALYNDEIVVPNLVARGIAPADARDYANVGCVEPVAAGKSFLSTDAALFNLPLCFELALNRGRRFGHWRRVGADTPPAERCASSDELFVLFLAQLRRAVTRLLREIRAIERANARFHPTPLTSMLVEGCLEAGRDATWGGARYNGSGIQGVGAGEVGDGFAAIEEVVFRRKAATLAEVVAACRRNFSGDDALRARLRNAPKYGNDDRAADGFVARVMEAFAQTLAGHTNARGGEYAAGFYSVTAHQAFGALVGALPSGRSKGRPFASGISPASGMDRKGPTAMLQSVASLPLRVAKNGANLNLMLPPWTLSGGEGPARLQALVAGGFRAGVMQLQVNVIDRDLLIEARDHPGRHPGLLVRVSGYSAYFDDLSPEMKQELIERTCAPLGT
ncbi:MAG: formate acetyltransferase [Deltaproteobacteria bacterium]|nr:formate acetyltransferase [Deltaproteobacteria bacterium]